MKRPDRIEWLYLGLAVVGIVAAGFLTSFHVNTGAADAFCTAASGCGTVKDSPYSEVWGVPIAVLGLAVYMVLALLAILAIRGFAVREWVPLAAFGLALNGTIYSAYLTYLELYVIHAVCPWCVASAVVLGALLALSLYDLLRLRRGPIPVRRA
jgi:uncharacterized membrane protein